MKKIEKKILKKLSKFNINKVIIWGHKLHTSTHSYIHYGWFKVFKYLNITTLWLDNNDNKNINFDNSLFFTEGNVDQNIPINHKSYYILHNCHDFGGKYKELISLKKVLILQKYENVIHKHNFKNFNNLPLTYYQDNNIVLSIPWATDLLPDEIKKNIKKFDLNNLKNESHFVGSKWEDNNIISISNVDILNTFEIECKKKKIPFKIHNNISEEENFNLISNTLYNISLQMDWQVKHNYIPCRIFKNISYGSIPVTNNKAVHKILDKKSLFVEDYDNIIDKIDNYIKDKNNDYFKKIMKNIEDNHTYLNRINTYLDFIDFIDKKNIINPNIDYTYNSSCCRPINYTKCLCGRLNYLLVNIIWIQAESYNKFYKLVPTNIKNNYLKIIEKNKNIKLNFTDKELKIKTWSEKDIIKLINSDYKEYKELYISLTDLRFKSDLARLFILYKYGGIYLDIDQDVLCDLNKFGIKSNNEICLVKSLENNNRISNGFMYVNKFQHEFIKKCIDNYTNSLKNNINYSGCDAITNVLNDINNNEYNILFLTENNTKDLKNCSSETEFNLSFYMFNQKGEKVMRSRYPDYYRDKLTNSDIEKLSYFI
jgi:hypothetical protein